MRYEGMIYRPPSEAYSLIVQVTIGCSQNHCIFCNMFKEKSFRIRKAKEVLEDLQDARNQYRHVEKILMKDQEELDKLQRLGISMIYMGLESGNDGVLAYMKKGVTAQEMIEAAHKVKKAGIRLSVTAISGLGGRKLWKDHAKDTGLVLSEMKPDYIGLLTLMIEEGLPLADKIRSGEFELLNPYDILIETKEMIKYLDCPGCLFRSNHASNYVNLRGTLNQDKETMIHLLDEAIKGNIHMKSEWMRAL